MDGTITDADKAALAVIFDAYKYRMDIERFINSYERIRIAVCNARLTDKNMQYPTDCECCASFANSRLADYIVVSREPVDIIKLYWEDLSNGYYDNFVPGLAKKANSYKEKLLGRLEHAANKGYCGPCEFAKLYDTIRKYLANYVYERSMLLPEDLVKLVIKISERYFDFHFGGQVNSKDFNDVMKGIGISYRMKRHGDTWMIYDAKKQQN